MSIRGRLEDTATRTVEKFAQLLVKLNSQVEIQVIGSGVSKSLYHYASRTLLLLILAVLATITAMTTFMTRYGTVAAIVAGLLAGVGVLSLGLALAINLPGLLYRSRGSKLEPRFPLFASALLSRLLAGTTLAYALTDMAKRDLPDLPWFRVELEYLDSMIRTGVDVHEALMRVAQITPSPSLKRLLSSVAAVSRTGVGLAEVVDTLLRDYLLAVAAEVDRVTLSLASILEFYVALSIMLPVVVGSLGLLLLFPLGQPLPGWLNFNSIVFLSTFVIVPLASAIIVILADMIVSRIRI